MHNPLRRALANSELLSFNVVRRDRWIAEQAARLASGTRVLDVGAGSCPYRRLFAHCKYSAQDLAPLHHDQLRFGAYGTIDYRCDATAIPVPDASFDAVLCTEMLEHHPEPIKVVREIARILTSGGRLILTAPLGSGIHQEPYHYYGGYTPFWYEKFLEEAGFEEVHIEPNAGTLRHCAQECIRLAQMTRPFALRMPWVVELIWAPFWLLLLPVFAIAVPLACKLLDRFDLEKRFTVGYHVTAVRSGSVATAQQ
jgi:ubiquinone/menaquinone biosynthesis C-methylase UbiE